MKQLVLILSIVGLVGCSSVTPVKRKFPDSIPELMQKCENLRTIPASDKVAITDMLKTVVENYQLYYTCSSKVDGWQEWYNEQKKIFDGVK